MAFQQTSATDWDTLLAALASFAATAGWTVEYNQTGQVAFSNGSAAIAIGTRVGQNPITRTVGADTYDDAILNFALSDSITPTNIAFWGHPGSLVTTSTDPDILAVNDLHGPFNNVWFFSDTSPAWIHAVVQSAGDRYTHFGFGIIDKLGATTPDCSFAIGMDYLWWPDGFNSNDPSSAQHKIGHIFDGTNSAHIRIPASTLPTGFPAAGIYKADQFNTSMSRGYTASDHWASNESESRFLDFFLAVSNQSVTGGTAMFALPVLVLNATSSPTSQVHLGNFPGIRLANVSDYTPGQELTFGTETWLIFPWKRKGLEENTRFGGNPQPEVNTTITGFAVQKVT